MSAWTAHAQPDVTALTSEDRAEIEALFTGFASHAMAGDWESYSLLFHQGASRKYPGTSDFLEGREMILEAVREVPYSIEHMEFVVLELEGNRQLAYALVTVDAILILDGQAISAEATALTIVRPEEDGAWKLYRMLHHANQ